MPKVQKKLPAIRGLHGGKENKLKSPNTSARASTSKIGTGTDSRTSAATSAAVLLSSHNGATSSKRVSQHEEGVAPPAAKRRRTAGSSVLPTIYDHHFEGNIEVDANEETFRHPPLPASDSQLPYYQIPITPTLTTNISPTTQSISSTSDVWTYFHADDYDPDGAADDPYDSDSDIENDSEHKCDQYCDDSCGHEVTKKYTKRRSRRLHMAEKYGGLGSQWDETYGNRRVRVENHRAALLAPLAVVEAVVGSDVTRVAIDIITQQGPGWRDQLDGAARRNRARIIFDNADETFNEKVESHTYFSKLDEMWSIGATDEGLDTRQVFLFNYPTLDCTGTLHWSDGKAWTTEGVSESGVPDTFILVDRWPHAVDWHDGPDKDPAFKNAKLRKEFRDDVCKPRIRSLLEGVACLQGKMTVFGADAKSHAVEVLKTMEADGWAVSFVNYNHITPALKNGVIDKAQETDVNHYCILSRVNEDELDVAVIVFVSHPSRACAAPDSWDLVRHMSLTDDAVGDACVSALGWDVQGCHDYTAIFAVPILTVEQRRKRLDEERKRGATLKLNATAINASDEAKAAYEAYLSANRLRSLLRAERRTVHLEALKAAAEADYQCSTDKTSAQAAYQAALDQDERRRQRNRLRYRLMMDAADAAREVPENERSEEQQRAVAAYDKKLERGHVRYRLMMDTADAAREVPEGEWNEQQKKAVAAYDKKLERDRDYVRCYSGYHSMKDAADAAREVPEGGRNEQQKKAVAAYDKMLEDNIVRYDAKKDAAAQDRARQFYAEALSASRKPSAWYWDMGTWSSQEEVFAVYLRGYTEYGRRKPGKLPKAWAVPPASTPAFSSSRYVLSSDKYLYYIHPSSWWYQVASPSIPI